MSGSPHVGGSRLDALRVASDELVDHVRALAEAVRASGSSAVSAVAGPVPDAAGEMLHSLRSVMQQTPAPAALLDVLMTEIGAKRALVRGLQEQLAAFDQELAVLEGSLAPVQAWAHQWAHLQEALVDTVLRRAPGQRE